MRIYVFNGSISAPANEAVEYIEHKFISALANTTEYMGFPDDEIDKRWSDLYNCMFRFLTDGNIIPLLTQVSWHLSHLKRRGTKSSNSHHSDTRNPGLPHTTRRLASVALPQ